MYVIKQTDPELLKKSKNCEGMTRSEIINMLSQERIKNKNLIDIIVKQQLRIDTLEAKIIKLGGNVDGD